MRVDGLGVVLLLVYRISKGRGWEKEDRGVRWNEGYRERLRKGRVRAMMATAKDATPAMDRPVTGHRADVRRLQIVKTLRSLGQGALFVTFALYLDELGWQASSIGLLFSAGGFLNAALSLPVGMVSDRWGRKRFVIANEAVIVLAAVAATLSSHPAVLAAASLLGAFGRGQVGMVGPAGPAEQAWIAELIDPRERGRVYSNNAALGFLGMAIGSVLAGLLPLWSGVLPGELAYRPFFVLIVMTGIINIILMSRTYENKPVAAAPAKPRAPSPLKARNVLWPTRALDEREIQVRREENLRILKLGAINSINGLGIGLTAPLLSYWFYIKFGAGPEALGPVFAITYLATGAASVISGRVAERIGLVRSVVSVRLLAVLFLLLLPIVPYFWMASTLHIVRSALNRGTIGTRQALTVSLVRDERRGFASAINSTSGSFPNALGPLIAGVMIEAGHLTLPFLVAAAMQFLYGVLFGRVFSGMEPTAKESVAPKTKSRPASRASS